MAKANILREMYGAKLEYLEGWKGVNKHKTFHGWGWGEWVVEL